MYSLLLYCYNWVILIEILPKKYRKKTATKIQLHYKSWNQIIEIIR